MSTTVIQIIESALRLTNVIDADESPTAEDGLKTLAILNDLMADMQADGIQLGWYPIADADISTNAPLQRQDVRGVKLCLAVELAPHFGVEPQMRLMNDRDEAYANLAKRGALRVELDLSGLPIADAVPYVTQTDH